MFRCVAGEVMYRTGALSRLLNIWLRECNRPVSTFETQYTIRNEQDDFPR
jgi:hypothetical protein